ncbi:MAG: hypothetical protein Ta2A_25150 [Treponemataceae bacterium]|nr:MAG: hypothetical protein Ta2A_25150 [Treponemataceae bacterium]
MYDKQKKVSIISSDFWVKQPAFLQFTWAVIDKVEREGQKKYIIFFIGDAGCIFDKIEYESAIDAKKDLKFNGFTRYADILKKYDKYGSAPPKTDYGEREYGDYYEGGNRNIYSSGRY